MNEDQSTRGDERDWFIENNDCLALVRSSICKWLSSFSIQECRMQLTNILFHSKVPYIAPPKPKSPLIFFQNNLSHITPDDTTTQNPPLIHDIIPTILQYCDAPTLSRFSSTCTLFRSMANNNDLWNRLCLEKFGVVAEELRPKPDPVRMLYVLQVRRMRDVMKRGVDVRVSRIRGDVLRSVLHASV